MKTPPMQPRRTSGDRGRDCSKSAAELVVSVHVIGPDTKNQREQCSRENAADERQEEEDRRERHPALRGEIERETPGGRGDQQGRDEGRTARIKSQVGGLSDALADPSHCEQKNRRGN